MPTQETTDMASLETFDEAFRRATKAVGYDYFALSVANSRDRTYLERVYCYELYHQLRNQWVNNGSIRIHAEVDKSGHKKIKGQDKPDFILHIPGQHEELSPTNFIVMEVKRARRYETGTNVETDKTAIKTDIDKLSKFRHENFYKRAIYLFFETVDSNTLIEQVRCALDGVDLEEEIELWLHSDVNERARLIAKISPPRNITKIA